MTEDGGNLQRPNITVYLTLQFRGMWRLLLAVSMSATMAPAIAVIVTVSGVCLLDSATTALIGVG